MQPGFRRRAPAFVNDDLPLKINKEKTMKGDFSKLEFDAADNYTGVLYQQGRVFVDTDGTAETLIESHLRTTLAQDTIGPDVAAVPAEAPDSLKVVQAEATGTEVKITLKPGRVWADGVPLFVPGTMDIELSAPYLPAPFHPTLPPAIDATAKDAVVLEVWEEAFNAFQDPHHLIEPALGGVDTTERVKVSYGLKLLRLDAGDECGNLADKLADDFAAKGKLTVTPSSSVSITGDCPVELGGGYTGFEHFLYRIEVAEPDGSGNARFKWSQFNGGLVGRGDFTSTGATTGTVHVKANNQMIDHCGLSSFYLEALAFDATVGHWRVVFTADATPQDDTLSLTNTSGTWPATAPATAFFRLWNGIALMSAFPIPPMGTEASPLKDGITLAFDAPAAGLYTPGDYWTLPVRASGSAIDADWIAANWPNNAPPHGVHYHRVLLAILNWSGAEPVTITAPSQIQDCRQVFQPLTRIRGCCRYTVGDGMASFGDFATIQAAVNALPATGGEICVLAGQYEENVMISGKDNITIKGCGERTRVATTTGGPVFAISDADNIRVESMAVIAGADSPGVQVAATPASRGIVLHNLLMSASTRGAIEVMGGRFIKIEECRIFMEDVSSPWPAVFVTADDVLIERNAIRVLPSRTPEFSRAVASAGRGGLQIGGTSERARIINNLIEGGIGNGITLGSLEQVREDGTVEPSDSGWVVDAFDPCSPCEPGDTHVPPESEGEDTPTYQSAGPLYDVLIERNRIFDMGLNGIGVVAFFDLSVQDEFITVVELHIVANEIRGCLWRTLATIPAEMLNAMGYGGIALADCELLTIHHNLIENNGPNHLEPICGIFVLHGEGLDISDNRIFNNGAKTDQPAHAAKDGRRGGINIVLAVATTTPTQIASRDTLYPIQDGIPAAKIHDNVVSQPLGQALSLTALGPVSVVNNHLVSRGMLLRANPLSPSFLASTVLIVNMGVSNEFYLQLFGFAALAAGNYDLASIARAPRASLDDKRIGYYLANGNILFNDNVCQLNLLESGVGFALSSLMLVSLDDVGFHNNQCDCDLLDDFVIVGAVVMGFSVRVEGNRFKEGVLNARYSAMTIGIMNATVGNQSTHCLWVIDLLKGKPGPSLSINSGNKVLADWLTATTPSLLDNFPYLNCKQREIDVTDAGFRLGAYNVKSD
jgi:hypothetical protein